MSLSLYNQAYYSFLRLFHKNKQSRSDPISKEGRNKYMLQFPIDSYTKRDCICTIDSRTEPVGYMACKPWHHVMWIQMQISNEYELMEKVGWLSNNETGCFRFVPLPPGW